MALGLPRTEADEPDVMLEINTTPLIDVLLVLLVILIITMPVQLQAIKMVLPGTAVVALPSAVAPIRISISADSSISFEGRPLTAAQLDERLALVARSARVPPIQIQIHRDAAYGVFVQVLAATRTHGLSRVAVVGVERTVP